jgi:P4 family phage/plasmid primase-like protien
LICFEVAGSAALGYATRLIEPKAVVLLGRTAENGKSQVLRLLRGLLPGTAVASVPPSKFVDERYVVKLVGKLLNTSDELGTASAISSDTFKHLVTGEPVQARDLYKSVIDFQGMAQHVFACNALPGFQGGMDRGVLRRLMVIAFNRTIPFEERIAHLGTRILEEEAELALSWAVEGAQRLIRRRTFADVPSSRLTLSDWTESDVVLAWIAERVVVGDSLKMTSNEAYNNFTMWAIWAGYKQLPAINTFSQRLKGAGLKYLHSGMFKGFVGVGVKKDPF